MYVTKEAIEEVRRSNNLLDVVRSHGIELKPRGRDYVGICPFHHHHTFRESLVAQDYLRGRGLTNPEMLRVFQAGYVDGSLLRMLDAGTRRRLRHLGLISPHGREIFKGCVVFPLTMPEDGMVGL